MRHHRRTAQFTYLLLIFMAFLLTGPVMAKGGDPGAAARAWPMIENGALLIDVRPAEVFAAGHVDGAINIRWDQTDALAAAIGEDKSRPVVVYCNSGSKAGKSKSALEEKGYTNIFNATGYESLMATKPR